MSVSIPETLIEYYHSYRSAIFSTSLTLGTFLFTMKAFIVLNMKKEVYDHKDYQAEVADRARAGKREPLYGGLRRLKWVLFWSIVLAITNALLQVTVGYIPKNWAIFVCFGMTGISWAVVGFCLFMVTQNLSSMLNFGESAFYKSLSPED